MNRTQNKRLIMSQVTVNIVVSPQVLNQYRIIIMIKIVKCA